MKDPGRDEFIKAIVKEINDHIVNTHWELVPRSDVPSGKKNIDYVWAIRRKRDIKTQKVLKYKAVLNVHVRQHAYDVHFFEIYYHVATCVSVCLMTTLEWLMNRHAIQCNFVITYPH
jgi:hypothetical protein